ncbi:MAG: asparaginase [Chloroflexi bacterium]|nr:asparaginase [Chloroflexota bacterium]
MTTTRRPLVYLLGTGGTISSLGHGPLDYTEYGLPGQRLSVEELVSRIPPTEGFPEVKGEQVLEVGSPSIGPKEWLMLAKKINGIFKEDPSAAGMAVTHGTNTLEETAFFLHMTVKSDKPVVVTGSMRPASAEGYDGTVNLMDALRIAASPQAKDKGVMTVLNNEIQSARDVTKSNTYRVDTFVGGPYGILGWADSDHQVVFYRSPARKHTHQTVFDVSALTELPRVDLVYAYGGGDGVMIRAAVQAGAQGIVSAGSGGGGGPADYSAALEEAVKQGVAVVQASHVGSGRVMLTSRRKEQGYLVSDDLSPKKARILLMLGLTVTRDREKLQDMFFSY